MRFSEAYAAHALREKEREIERLREQIKRNTETFDLLDSYFHKAEAENAAQRKGAEPGSGK